MKLVPILVLAGTISTAASGQAFQNLDFEAANTLSAASPISVLDWNLAAPGWNHSLGADTAGVYYGGTHLGTTQWFLLVDSATSNPSPLAGAYSLAFSSGYDTSQSPNGPWVNAYVSQVGLVPASMKSLTFLATGPLGVFIDGATIPVLSLGGSSYAADISSYAGLSVEMKFLNTSLQLFEPVTLDNIAFSVSPVPEPPIWVLLGLGAVCAPWVRGRTRRQQISAS